MICYKHSTSSLHQGVEQLTEKCQQLQAELKDCRQELERLQTEHTGVQAEMEALRSKFTPPLLSITKFTFMSVLIIPQCALQTSSWKTLN